MRLFWHTGTTSFMSLYELRNSPKSSSSLPSFQFRFSFVRNCTVIPPRPANLTGQHIKRAKMRKGNKTKRSKGSETNRNIESGFARETFFCLALTDSDLSQIAIIQINNSFPTENRTFRDAFHPRGLQRGEECSQSERRECSQCVHRGRRVFTEGGECSQSNHGWRAQQDSERGVQERPSNNNLLDKDLERHTR